ncbi:MAG: Uma2 family endonuclease [Maricaulaceae bacterium]
MTAAPKLMTADEFLVWCLTQDGRWELVGGVPVRTDLAVDFAATGEPIELMTGATRRHDKVVVNILIALGNRLRGGPCQPHTDDVAFRASATHVRRPDVTVDCASQPDDRLDSDDPRAVFEVLSPSTRQIDRLEKLQIYQADQRLRHIVLVEPAEVKLMVWSRPDASADWTLSVLTRVEETLDLDTLNVVVPLAEIYDGLPMEPEA